jgi:proline dehydrogenase
MNTYQAYLKNTFNRLQADLHLANREGFHFGCKLVRGAYMDQERARAKEFGYECPIQPTYEQTGAMYHQCLAKVVEERYLRGPGRVAVMAASHNEETVRFAVIY